MMKVLNTYRSETLSIKKLNNLKYVKTFPTFGEFNDSHDLEFNVYGLDIEGDLLSWQDIIDAYRELSVIGSQENNIEN